MCKNVKDIHSKERVGLWNQSIENHKFFIDDSYQGGSNNFNSILNFFLDEQVLKSLLGYKLQVVIGGK